MRRSWVFVSVLFIVATLVRFVPASAAPPASPSMYFRLHVEGRSVRGRINAAEAAFTHQEDLQRCDAPMQTFLAGPLPSPAGTSVRGSGAPSAAVGSTTRYHGTTSQALPISFDLLGTAQLGSLATADLFSGLSCDDGTTFSWTIGLIVAVPAFTEEEDLQTCSSGRVGWIAKPGV